MRITFLGSADAFTHSPDNYQSNLILQKDTGKKLLIDCGSEARRSLHELGIDSSSVDAVYISHLHADHIGGLEWFGFTRYFNRERSKPKLFLHKSLEKDLWEKSLSGGMNCLEDKEAQLSSFFEVHAVEKSFEWEGTHFELVETQHAFHAGKKLPCFGLFFERKQDKVFFSGDTRLTPETLMPYYKKADLIFHECETKEQRTPVHSHYDDLKTLDEGTKKKMWLYHYNDGPLPDAQTDGFAGFIKKHQSF